MSSDKPKGKLEMKVHEPAMTFVNEEGRETWNKGLENNQDFYGYGVYCYASEWATRMESEIENGADLHDIAERTSHEADGGISGFMYGCAVGILAKVWIHGERLRRWHNLDRQINDEGEAANRSGGVLNPAVINIAIPEKGERP